MNVGTEKNGTDLNFVIYILILCSEGFSSSEAICNADVTKFMDKNSTWINLHWPSTAINSVAEPDTPCLSDEGTTITRKCLGNSTYGAFWEPVIDQCDTEITDRTSSLHNLSKSSLSNENVNEVAEELSNLTQQSDSLLPADVNYVSQCMEKISHLDNFAEEIITNVANVVESLINTKEMSKSTLEMTSSGITKSFTDILMKSNRSIRIDKPSLYAETIISPSEPIFGISLSFDNTSQFDSKQVKHLKSDIDTDSLNSAVALILPKSLQTLNDSNSRIGFKVYKDSRLFPVRVSGKFINSLIVSADVDLNQYELDESSPVQMIFLPLQSNIPLENSSCVFWNYSLNDEHGGWSDNGCRLEETRKGRLKCSCTHLTHFAVLMDTMSSFEHNFHLTVISYIGCALSIVGLSLTVITFVLFKNWRKKLGNKVLCNFSVSLFFVLVIFLSGFQQVNSPKTCIAVAVLLHYFLLVTFAWMLVEGVLHYLLFVRVFNAYISKFMMKAMICAWGLPVIIVATVLCIDVELYVGSPHYCWMSRKAMIFSFLIPIGIIIVLNALFFVLVLKSISCKRKNISNKKDNNFKQIYAAICILILLGLTWLFGFLAVNELRTFFQYLFCVCNSLQGFLIFFFMVVRDNNAQDLWMAFLPKRQNASIENEIPKRNRNQQVLSMEETSIRLINLRRF